MAGLFIDRYYTTLICCHSGGLELPYVAAPTKVASMSRDLSCTLCLSSPYSDLTASVLIDVAVEYVCEEEKEGRKTGDMREREKVWLPLFSVLSSFLDDNETRPEREGMAADLIRVGRWIGTRQP